MSAQRGDQPPVVDVAAGGGVDVAGVKDMDRAARHGQSIGASYQARATWLSCSVTRIEARSRPGRPSAPARAARANPSKICLVRNSVVVLTPANSGTSSRLR